MKVVVWKIPNLHIVEKRRLADSEEGLHPFRSALALFRSAPHDEIKEALWPIAPILVTGSIIFGLISSNWTILMITGLIYFSLVSILYAFLLFSSVKYYLWLSWISARYSSGLTEKFIAQLRNSAPPEKGG